MSWTPTDEQVEQHARVGYDFDEQHRVLFGHQTEPLPFESQPRWAQDTHRDKARAQLVAVGPHIAAQAWDEAVNAITYPAIDEGRLRMTLRLVLPLPENPYSEKEAGR